MGFEADKHFSLAYWNIVSFCMQGQFCRCKPFLQKVLLLCINYMRVPLIVASSATFCLSLLWMFKLRRTVALIGGLHCTSILRPAHENHWKPSGDQKL